MAVQLHPHAAERIVERGIFREEAIETVEHGEQYPAKFGRSGFRRNFEFDSEWRGKHYLTKQVEVIAVREGDDWIVVTAIARYF